MGSICRNIMTEYTARTAQNETMTPIDRKTTTATVVMHSQPASAQKVLMKRVLLCSASSIME